MEHTAHFTGHRPDKLRGGYNYHTPSNLELGRAIRDAMIFLIEKKEITHFVFGGALGVDQIACLVGIKLKLSHPNIILELALPYDNMDRIWQEYNCNIHKRCLDEVDIVTQVDALDFYSVNSVEIGEYHIEKLQKRNEYMVYSSRITIAVWDGAYKGGTYNCIKSSALKGNDLLVIPIKEGRVDKDDWTEEQSRWVQQRERR